MPEANHLSMAWCQEPSKFTSMIRVKRLFHRHLPVQCSKMFLTCLSAMMWFSHHSSRCNSQLGLTSDHCPQDLQKVCWCCGCWSALWLDFFSSSNIYLSLDGASMWGRVDGLSPTTGMLRQKHLPGCGAQTLRVARADVVFLSSGYSLQLTGSM